MKKILILLLLIVIVLFCGCVKEEKCEKIRINETDAKSIVFETSEYKKLVDNHGYDNIFLKAVEADEKEMETLNKVDSGFKIGGSWIVLFTLKGEPNDFYVYQIKKSACMIENKIEYSTKAAFPSTLYGTLYPLTVELQ